MDDASMSLNMSPLLLKVVERAKREPEGRFHTLAHLIDAPALVRAFQRARSDAAVGVDGMTKAAYGKQLQVRVQDLHARLKQKRYRPQPIRRVHIPKGQGKTRPIGISTLEDKLVQDALREVLEAIYEQDFLDCSYGFRPQRGAHDAIRRLDQVVHADQVCWILEADIVSFFDSLNREELKKMLQIRVADESLLRLIGKCLHVGVLEGAMYFEPETGATQGSVLSPLLGNIYMHYVLDLWFEEIVKPRLRGKASLIRYADDFVITFKRQDDAQAVMDVLPKRLGKYGLSLHPDKTRLFEFRRPPKQQISGKGTATFDFLGFTFYWARAATGRWGMWGKTRRASLRKAIKSIYEWCRSHRHQPVEAQRKSLARRVRGHYNYFGVSGNYRSLLLFEAAVQKAWYKWLCRRSQRRRLWWSRYSKLLRSSWRLPSPRIAVQIWGA
jgi:group II intron reverse transcriptase/maturase